MQIQLSDHFDYKKLLRFTLPSIVMMIFTSVYVVVDGFFVSNYAGKTALAAVNYIYPYLQILGAVGFMIGTGGSALVAKTLGEGKPGEARRLFSLFVRVSGMIGVLFMILGMVTVRPMAVWLGAEGQMLEDCVSYGMLFLISLPAFILQMEFQSFMIVAEKPKLGLVFTVLAGVTNMVFDWLLVAILHWGIMGAAVATSFSQIVGGAVPLVYFICPNSSLLRLGSIRTGVGKTRRSANMKRGAARRSADVKSGAARRSVDTKDGIVARGSAGVKAEVSAAGNVEASVGMDARTSVRGTALTNAAALWKSFTNGSSELMNNISMSVVAMLYNIQLMKYAGENGVAAYSVIMYVMMIFTAVFLGYSIGVAPVVSFHYGAGNHQELKGLLKRSLTIIGIFSVLMFVLGEVLASPLSSLFVGYHEELFQMTCQGFTIYSFMYLFAGFAIFGSGFFTALNDGITSAVIAFLRTLVFEAAAILILPAIWGLKGIWLSVVVAEVLAALLCAAFLLGKRKRYHYM